MMNTMSGGDQKKLGNAGVFTTPSIERIHFAQPAGGILPAELTRLSASRAFLMVSQTLNRSTDKIAGLRAALGERCVGVFDGVRAHANREVVLNAAAQARDACADVIVSVGGGAVTDSAKMLRLCLNHQIKRDSDFDHLASAMASERAVSGVRQIAIPTTLSAAEFSARAGCIDGAGEKHTYRDVLMMPRVVILDPALTMHTPQWAWLSSGVRTIDHAVEGLCSQFSNPVGDAHFLHALRLLNDALPRVRDDPLDLNARLDCQFATWLAMSGRSGGVQMGASHAIGHVLNAQCGVPQGYTSCVMLPHVLRYNLSANAKRQQCVSEAMGHPGENAADVITAFVAALGLPGRLSEVGITRERFDFISDHAMRDEWIRINPRAITSAEAIGEILAAAA